jgi:hypothetical protein
MSEQLRDFRTLSGYMIVDASETDKPTSSLLSAENSSSFVNNTRHNLINEIFLIESSTRWQCFECDQMQAAEENVTITSGATNIDFFLGITSSRRDANVWSAGYKYKN